MVKKVEEQNQSRDTRNTNRKITSKCRMLKSNDENDKQLKVTQAEKKITN